MLGLDQPCLRRLQVVQKAAARFNNWHKKASVAEWKSLDVLAELKQTSHTHPEC